MLYKHSGTLHVVKLHYCNRVRFRYTEEMLALNSLQSCAVAALNPVRKSCWEIKSLRPDAPSGTYQITGLDGKPISVTCDMTGQGGGWTLAGVAMFANRGQAGASNFLSLMNPFR